MPELPEVENFRQKIDPIVLNKKIKDIIVHDDYILKMPEKKFKNSLINKEFRSTKRVGKYIFIQFDSKDLLLHFAMTGNIEFFNNKNDEPEYGKILFEFDDNSYLSIISIRKFGKVEVVDNFHKYIKDNKIGPDALDLNFEEFKKIMEDKKRSYAKTALMDQSALSGIGNLFSDEILFRAQIHPKTKISNLNEEKVGELYDSMIEILNQAINLKLKKKGYPNDFLIPHREKEGICPKCRTKIKRIEISSRHGYYCPNCQPQIAK